MSSRNRYSASRWAKRTLDSRKPTVAGSMSISPTSRILKPTKSHARYTLETEQKQRQTPNRYRRKLLAVPTSPTADSLTLKQRSHLVPRYSPRTPRLTTFSVAVTQSFEDTAVATTRPVTSRTDKDAPIIYKRSKSTRMYRSPLRMNTVTLELANMSFL